MDTDEPSTIQTTSFHPLPICSAHHLHERRAKVILLGLPLCGECLLNYVSQQRAGGVLEHGVHRYPIHSLTAYNDALFYLRDRVVDTHRSEHEPDPFDLPATSITDDRAPFFNPLDSVHAYSGDCMFPAATRRHVHNGNSHLMTCVLLGASCASFEANGVPCVARIPMCDVCFLDFAKVIARMRQTSQNTGASRLLSALAHPKSLTASVMIELVDAMLLKPYQSEFMWKINEGWYDAQHFRAWWMWAERHAPPETKWPFLLDLEKQMTSSPPTNPEEVLFAGKAPVPRGLE